MKLHSKTFYMESLAYQNTELLAYLLFKNQGDQEGSAIDYWLEAERQLNENLFGDPFLV